MDERRLSPEPNTGEDAANDQMVQQMDQRRGRRSERHVARTARVTIDRRSTCVYCYQPGNHRTPADCLRALER
jgi:hypothetical protein